MNDLDLNHDAPTDAWKKKALLAMQKLQARIDALEKSRCEPIAIVGLSCRFPLADSSEAFWQQLAAGQDAIREIPPNRWNVDEYYDPDPSVPGKMYSRFGGFLDSVDQFDAKLFGIAPREAARMDPQHRLLLEVSWEALEHAGVPPRGLKGGKVGVYVGISTNDYAQLLGAQGEEAIDAYTGTGTSHSTAVGRISYVLGLEGPNMAIDTACSSSLVAIHEACQSLRLGDCHLALAGGVNAILTPDLSINFSKARMLAPDGRCKTFDASADGYVRGEGCGVVVLKRLADAQHDGDTVLAVVRGSAVNQDGASSGLTVPNGPSQERVIRDALRAAGLEPHDVAYVEAHGTGTALGDPIEIQALGNVLANGRAADRPLLVGSVKTNIGHLEAAAGVAGLIKVVLALTHDQIPAHLHFQNPNPHIDWERIPLRVTHEPTAWPTTSRRHVAGVSSFGFSGTNAHIVLEEAPVAVPLSGSDPVEGEVSDDPQLITLSGHNTQVIRDLAGRYKHWIDVHASARLADIGYTASAGRSHLRARAAVVATSKDEAQERLAALSENRQPLPRGLYIGNGRQVGLLAWLFTGQGSQYAGMGCELYDAEPVFRDVLDHCQESLKDVLDRPLLDVMFVDQTDNVQRLDQTEYTQPALFALQMGLAELYRSWGVQPDVVVGHSVGQFAAACVAGVFSLDDGLRLIAHRGRLMGEMPRGGGMLAVFTSETDELQALMQNLDLAIAAYNGTHVVVSGSASEIQTLQTQLADKQIRAEPLATSHAFHSRLIEPALESWLPFARQVDFQPAQRILISNVSGRALDSKDVLDADYWCHHARNPVQFARSMQTLAELGCQLLVELGPHPVLLGMAAAAWPGDPTPAVATSLRRGQPDALTLRRAVAEQYVHGVTPDFAAMHKPTTRRKLPLPTYSFQKQRHWIGSAANTAPAREPLHPLLGTPIKSPGGLGWHFEKRISAEDPAFLQDHRLWNEAVFPGTAYLEMALAAARVAIPNEPHVLKDIAFEQPLILGADQASLVRTALMPNGPDFSFDFLSDPAGNGSPSRKRQHASGQIVKQAKRNDQPGVSLADRRNECTEEVPMDEIRRRLEDQGFAYGPSFQQLRRVWRGHDQVVGLIEATEQLTADLGDYLLHPALLDASLQVMAGMKQSEIGLTYVPVRIGKFELFGPPSPLLWIHAKLTSVDDSQPPDRFEVEVTLFDSEGTIVAGMEGLQMQKLGGGPGDQGPDGSAWAEQARRAESRRPSNDIADQLIGLAPEEQLERLKAVLQEELTAVLELDPSEEIDPQESFFEMGLDSLMGADLMLRMNHALQIKLPVERLLQFPAIAPLAAELVREFQEHSRGPAPAGESMQSTADVPSLPVPDASRRREQASAALRLFCLPVLSGEGPKFAEWSALLPPEIELMQLDVDSVEPEFLADRILEHLDRPFALFGHGAAAGPACGLVRLLGDRMGLTPTHLILGAPVPAPACSQHPLDIPIIVISGGSECPDSPDELMKWHQQTCGGFRLELVSDREPTYVTDVPRVVHAISRDLTVSFP